MNYIILLLGSQKRKRDHNDKLKGTISILITKLLKDLTKLKNYGKKKKNLSSDLKRNQAEMGTVLHVDFYEVTCKDYQLLVA